MLPSFDQPPRFPSTSLEASPFFPILRGTAARHRAVLQDERGPTEIFMNLVRIGRQVINMDLVRIIQDEGESGFRLHFDGEHRTDLTGDDARALRIWLEAHQDLVVPLSRPSRFPA